MGSTAIATDGIDITVSAIPQSNAPQMDIRISVLPLSHERIGGFRAWGAKKGRRLDATSLQCANLSCDQNDMFMRT